MYRWKLWRAYARRYKVEELEGMDNELDRKLEALSKLQLLLQEHGSVKPSTTPPVLAGGDLIQSVGEALKGALDSSTSSTVPSPTFSPIPSAPQSPGPPTSKAAQFMKDHGSVLPVLSRAPTTSSLPMTAREKRKAQDQKIASRRNMLEQVDLSIRSTLSSLNLQAGGEVHHDNSLMQEENTGTDTVTEGNTVTEGETAAAATAATTAATKPSQITVDLIKEAALIATSLLCPCKVSYIPYLILPYYTSILSLTVSIIIVYVLIQCNAIQYHYRNKAHKHQMFG